MKVTASGIAGWIIALLILFGMVSFFRWLGARATGAAVHVQTVQVEGRKYIVVTSDQSVAVCPVPP